MALRYAVEVAFSPVGGQLAHHFGARPILVLSSLGAAAGLALLSSEQWLWFGVVATIVLRALVQPLTAPMVAEAHPGSERVRALARQATWRDIGAGTGPLAAGLLFPIMAPIAIYGGASVLLAATSLLLIGVRRPGPAPSVAMAPTQQSDRRGDSG
jgi:MFS family permease